MRGLPVSTTINPTMPVCPRGADSTAAAPAFSSTQYNDRSGWPLLSAMIRYQRNRWLGPLLLMVASMVGLAARPVYAGDPSFAQAIPFGANETSYSVALGDLNNDGLLDILQGKSGQSLIYLNEGQGRFPITGIPAGNPALTRCVAIGDFNGDGWLDIFLGNTSDPFDGTSSGQSYVYLNDGRGRFSGAGIPLGNDADTISVTVGDFNGDGWLDIIQGTGGQSYLHLNDGEGHFIAIGIPVTGNVGDLNGDGWLDIISGNDIYLNDGQGQFTTAGIPLGSSNVGGVAVGDLNRDGWLDIVQGNVPDFLGGTGNEPSYVYLNDGQGHFSIPGAPFGNGKETTSIAVGDLNGDGWLDIIQGNRGVNYVYFNDGTGHFPVVGSAVGKSEFTQEIAVGDLNDDGWLDIIQANLTGQSYFFLNDGQAGFRPHRQLGSFAPGYGIAVGDLNGDGWLDIVQGSRDLIGPGGLQSYLYFNDGQGQFPLSGAPLGRNEDTYTMAVGDLNNDTWLDLVQGNGFGPTYIYRNEGQGRFPPTGVELSKDWGTWSIALGDLNGDGWLDLVQGRTTQSYVYLNDGQGNFPAPSSMVGATGTNNLALGDVNLDGWLDLIQGRSGQSYVYLNDGAGSFSTPGSPLGSGESTQSVAVGDLNRDGFLDIVQGNWGRSYLYFNDGQGGFTQRVQIGNGESTQSVAVGDLNEDGLLDIVQGNNGQSYLYLNGGQNGFFQRIPIDVAANAVSLALGDFNGDSSLDLAQGGDPQSYVYWNPLKQSRNSVNRPPRLTVLRPVATGNANFFSTPVALRSPTIPITYTLFDPEGDRVGRIEAFYSPDGGGRWLPAVAASGAITQHLPATPAGITYTFPWDTFASGFFGQSDHVVIRLIAYSQPSPAATPLTSGYRYTNTVPGAYLWPYASATTFPFRVRGTQVRVIDDQGNPVANAQLYRRPNDSTTAAELMPDASQPLQTTVNGYLPGRGALSLGDQLVALAPISHSLNYTLYATSAAPTENGLALQPVTQSGVQTLTVSAAHPLLLFDLDVSLEWDASQDGLFYDQLKTAFERASAILYDVSDGQIALGAVRIHPNREAWLAADVVIYANNNLRPRATMGGLVETPADDVQGSSGKPLKAAYTPGQVRMGPIWDPFGQNFAELTQDWQRALAHELAHYLLYLPDNYLGVENGSLRITNCQGSLMTDAYNPDYSEFLTPTEWTQTPGNPCLRTVAATLLTGRSDWATINHFYPGLQIPQTKLKGPALLPLNVTQVRVLPPATGQTQPVAARNYDLRNENNNVTVLHQAQAYVLQSQGTTTTTDDSLLYLGSTGVGSDRILVRGTRVGDQVCVIDNASEPMRVGCEEVKAQSTSIQVQSVPGWRPDIQIAPVTSTTFQITVTQASQVGQLFAQFLPAYGPADDASAIRSVTQPLNQSPTVKETYSARITLPYPIFEGFVRVYSDKAADRFQAITQFFLSGDWGPPNAWSGRVNRAWGANTRSLEAPVASGDGKVMILNLDDLLADTGDTTLQAITDLPNLPPWLTAVGAGYRIQSKRDLTRTLMFEYSQRDVPPGYEQTLNLYYLPAGATDWQRLKTGPLDSGVDVDDNLATVIMPHANQGQGIYALMATVQLPPLIPGWNPLNYPVGAAQSVTNALASLDGAYSTVYAYQPGAPLPWPLYDRTVEPAFAPLVNTLVTMTFGSNYLIYATQVVTPYIGVVGDGAVQAAALQSNLVDPPATFYGTLSNQADPIAAEGMTIQAKIGSTVCGESTLQKWKGELAYVIQVKADSNDGCGAPGRMVVFYSANKPISPPVSWDNEHVVALLSSAHSLYLPLVAR